MRLLENQAEGLPRLLGLPRLFLSVNPIHHNSPLHTNKHTPTQTHTGAYMYTHTHTPHTLASVYVCCAYTVQHLDTHDKYTHSNCLCVAVNLSVEW